MDEERLRKDFESMFSPAKLHPDLAACITKEKEFSFLRHPLVYAVPYTEQMNNYYNQRYELMKAETLKALSEGNFSRYVFMHERPYRLNAFMQYLQNNKVPNKVYWELLGSIWSDSENIWQNLWTWKNLLKSTRPCRGQFMDKDERKEFKKLPNKLTAYRGCIRGQNENGMSWTLDKKKAVWFSERFIRKPFEPCVIEKDVNKNEIFAYLTGRNENEVIIL